MRELRVGAEVAGYRVDAVAGRGGMGTVYRATQLSLGRTVALKVISAAGLDEATARDQMHAEARAAAALDHPNVVSVYDAGKADGLTFIAMRFVEGPDLRQLLACGAPLDVRRGLRLLSQVADALDAAHASGLVHRDVKPANILVGAGDHAFLTDFGLTRPAAAADAPTVSGRWVGTPDYVAPEQIRGEPVSAATDVYALGCVLYRILTGRLPFERETVDACVWAQLHAAPPPPSRIDPVLDPFDEVLARALAKDPARRYASAGDLVRDATRALDGQPTRALDGQPARALDGQPARALDGQPARGPLRPAVRRSRGASAVPAGDRGHQRTETRGPVPQRSGMTRISSRALVGRGDELARLHAAVDRAAAGLPSVTWVAGEAGIGKSRLVAELAVGVRARGARVLIGACVGLDTGELPYGPIVGALRQATADGLPAALDALDPAARAALTGALPELGPTATTTPAAPTATTTPAAPTATTAPAAAGGAAASGQSLLFGSLVSVLGHLSGAGASLLVLEDLHWADPSTRDFVRYFASRAADERVAVVATFRSDELGRRHPLRALLAELARSARVDRIELGRLTRAEVAVQLAEILDAAPAARLVDEIFGRSEGNPFYAEELLAMARSGADAEAELPGSLRDALLVRIDSVSEAARDVLRTAAVVGRAVDHTLLGASTGLAAGRLGSLLREAVGAHVLIAEGIGEGERLHFRHALVREAVYADLLAVEKADLHRQVAKALAARRDFENPGELAHHWQAAGEPGPAMTASVDAGLAAARSYSFRDAAGHFERAIELWPRAGDAHATVRFDRAGLCEQAAEAAWSIGDVERAAQLCRQALELIDAVSDPVRAAAVHERLGRASLSTPESALASYARALALLPPGPSAPRARLLGNKGLALTYLDRWEDSRRDCEQAVDVARIANAPAEEARAMSTLGLVLTFLGRPGDGEPMLRRALAMTVGLGRASDTARAQINLGEVLRYRGRVAEALQAALDGELMARRAGLDLFHTYLSLSAADDLFNLGRWDEAHERVDALDPDLLELTGRELWLSLAGRLAVARGDGQAAERHLVAASALCDGAQPEQVPHVYGARAELALWQGQPTDARRLVAKGLELIGRSEDALNTPVLLGIGVRAATEAGMQDGGIDRDTARAAGTALAGRLERLLDDSAPPQGRAHLAACDAELRRLDGEPAVDRWERVAVAWEALDQPYPAAYARLRSAEALALVATTGELEHTQRLVSSLRIATSRLGAGFLHAAADRLEAVVAVRGATAHSGGSGAGESLDGGYDR